MTQSRWEEFRRRYRAELSSRPERLNRLRALAEQGTLTLVYAARDEDHNQAVALRGYASRGEYGIGRSSTFSGTRQRGST